MIYNPIHERAIFVEREGWAYYVTNWQQRFVAPMRALLVRLSPRHFVRYNALKEKGRGEKTIAYLLFKRVKVQVVKENIPISKVPSVAPSPTAPTVVSIEIDLLTADQLARLIQRSLQGEFPGLQSLPLEELRKMYVAIQEKCRAATSGNILMKRSDDQNTSQVTIGP
jgi:hypothetical protein